MDFEEQRKLEEIKYEAQRKLEEIKCSNQLRIEDFKDRRNEIDVLIKDTRNVEIYSVVGTVVYYAWLMTHCAPGILWFIPISVPLLGAWRSWENIAQVANIAKYIKE